MQKVLLRTHTGRSVKRLSLYVKQLGNFPQNCMKLPDVLVTFFLAVINYWTSSFRKEGLHRPYSLRGHGPWPTVVRAVWCRDGRPQVTLCLQSGSRECVGNEVRPQWLIPPVRLHLLKIPQPSKQLGIKHKGLWGAFQIWKPVLWDSLIAFFGGQTPQGTENHDHIKTYSHTFPAAPLVTVIKCP